MDYSEETDTCQLNSTSSVVYKLPNSAIDVCLIYGIDENTDRCLKPLNSTKELGNNNSSVLEVSCVIDGFISNVSFCLYHLRKC